MKNLFSKAITVIFVLALVICITPVYAEPGGSDDPLITLSYVEDVLIPQMKSYVDSSVANSSAGSQNVTVEGGTYFNVVNVSKGQTIIGDRSCQMILRMGSGKIVATKKGGIADVTLGYDLPDGVDAPSNHLLIIPVDDGRGIKMTSDGIIMICGSYSVKR
ncbi:MAG: hypothetical protein E7394_03010 [Ruminococcaceae bacterium]|nr:hypothetical protein [Oscillospiraceae bacterium]